MNQGNKTMLVISALGAISGLLSVVSSLLKGELLSGIVFGLMGLFCFSNAFKYAKHK